MPDLLLRDLTPQQAADLLEFLAALKSVGQTFLSAMICVEAGKNACPTLLAPVPPPRFHFASSFLFIELPHFGTAGGLGRATLLGWTQHREHHLTQLLVASLNVPRLIAEFFAMNYYLACVGETCLVPLQKSLPHIGRQAGRRQHLEVEHRFARYLVDVLPARSAAAGKAECSSAAGILMLGVISRSIGFWLSFNGWSRHCN